MVYFELSKLFGEISFMNLRYTALCNCEGHRFKKESIEQNEHMYSKSSVHNIFDVGAGLDIARPLNKRFSWRAMLAAKTVFRS